MIAAGLSLLTLPFGWSPLDGGAQLYLVAAGVCGGIAQILLTESYRQADVSTVAPFEYTSIMLGGLIGYFVFDDRPTIHTLVGAAIVVGAGIFIIYRERQLNLARRADANL